MGFQIELAFESNILFSLLNGLLQRVRLLLVLKPGECRGTDILRLRIDVVEEAVSCGLTLYLWAQGTTDPVVFVSVAYREPVITEHIAHLLHVARRVRAEERDLVADAVEGNNGRGHLLLLVGTKK